MQIKVMADYECSPLWWDQPDRVGNIFPDDLGLSENLSTELMAWACRYDATLNREDPISSGFASMNDERIFHEEGERLTTCVAEELGRDVAVRYLAFR